MMPNFGDRFAELFAGKKQREIAEILDVTDGAVRHYLGGRVPDAEKLQLIANVTKCNLHWLITGDGTQFQQTTEHSVRTQLSFDALLEHRIRDIVREEISGDRQDEIGPFKKADVMLARSLGKVDGGEEEENLRKTG